MLVGIVATYQEYFNQTGIRTLNVLELAQRAPIATASRCGSLPPSLWRLPSRSRCGRSIPGCRTPTSRRRPPDRCILAGVLLKIGGYGLIRFNLPLFPDAARTYAARTS